LCTSSTGIGVSEQGPGCVLARPSYPKTPALSAVTSLFLHGSWLHLLGNMLFLWIFGNNIEDRFGRLRYLLFYLGCGVVATYGFALANPNTS
jgi:membrane associated rhomboid family serine protease